MTRWQRLLLLALPVLAVLQGCGDEAPSTLEPEGAGARRIASLWWLMLGLGTAVFVAVVALIAFSWRRRRRGSLDVNRFVLVGGVLLPSVVLVVVGVETVRATNAVFEAEDRDRDPDVVVVGEQWWWRVTYPDVGVVTANEVHIPAGRPVTVELHSADVNHSFWVPQVAGKIDMIPGQTNRLVLEADRPGTYRGKCAEFCGLQHANMRFLVVAHEPNDFTAWLDARREPPPPPSGLAAEGQRVFLEQPCAGCHRIEGTPARSTVGPDLTDFGARQEVGAGLAENNAGNLGGWIANPFGLKPGARMPPSDVTGPEMQALIAYLEGLQPR